MPVDPRRVKELFAAAIDLPPVGRPAFLDHECGPDAELRERVARLLAAHDAPLSDLERTLAVDATADLDFTATRTGGDVPVRPPITRARTSTSGRSWAASTS